MSGSPLPWPGETHAHRAHQKQGSSKSGVKGKVRGAPIPTHRCTAPLMQMPPTTADTDVCTQGQHGPQAHRLWLIPSGWRGSASPARPSQTAACHPPAAAARPGRWFPWQHAALLWPSGSPAWLSELPAEPVQERTIMRPQEWQGPRWPTTPSRR